MAETVQEKSRGLKFAEQQLLRHGWEQGKGLGRQENGISEAIKVKVKCDKGGVGHRQGEQFTFHWWDHVFNKASSSLEVESGENGVQVKKLVEEEEEGMISNKKPTKAMLGRDKLYGCFVKSATLLAGLEQPEQKSSSTDDSSSDDEDQRLDLSSTTKLSDADLVKACGGRTAHKGARHGLTMSAKLARLEQQEQEFMAKYGKKNQLAAATPDSVTTQPAAQIPEDELTHETPGKKAKKKKRKNHSEDTRENVAEENADSAVVSGSTNMEIKVKKKKKKESLKENTGEVAVVPVEEELTSVEDNSADNAQTTKRKRSKQRKVLEEGESCHLNGEVCETDVISIESDAGGGCEDASEGEGATRQQTDSDTTTKKKKSSKNKEVAEEMEHSKDRETNQSETVADSPPKKKKKRDGTMERKEVRTVEEEPKIKGKKKKMQGGQADRRGQVARCIGLHTSKKEKEES
ncbi:G patch domain-containing protein 4 [Salvelinus namaycush]|uniref:G patch domain-containing protein 4 n=1 Tax=Salvelinus namaycush TaxID=8040 RepID=A0A8U0PUT6_SALNM|nr:G patch domain-containing protein 4 [Salvelinus namaycush]XP_038832481.1 G patch domain-containing protein 4 [Salvelinus namaycush]